MTSETESAGKAQIGHVLTIEVAEYSILAITEQNRITEAPIECAMEIATATKKYPEIRLPMGIHSGPQGTRHRLIR
jgi:hypothetical protein